MPCGYGEFVVICLKLSGEIGSDLRPIHARRTFSVPLPCRCKFYLCETILVYDWLINVNAVQDDSRKE